MEVISYNSPPCCKLNRRLLAKKSSSRQKVKIPLCRKHRILCTRVQFRCGSPELSDKHQLLSNDVYHEKVSRPFRALEGFNNGESKVLSGNYDSYVISGEDKIRGMSETGEAGTKVWIPGLPDESIGECSAQISSCFWEWKPKFNVHYEKSGSENVNSPLVLFLPGMSLPFEDPTSSSKEEGIIEGKDSLWGFGDKSELWAIGLGRTSEVLLCEKLFHLNFFWSPTFKRTYFWLKNTLVTRRDSRPSKLSLKVIGEPVYIVGNSLGGFVALYFAARNPELVKGVYTT
ncbi:hypothetical protein V6N13_140101 [Hibiscus sabdariffa]